MTIGPAESLGVLRDRGAAPGVDRVRRSRQARDCLVQLRAHGEVHAGSAVMDGGLLRITLREPARGVAPGQAAVLYDGDVVLGSATITATL